MYYIGIDGGTTYSKLTGVDREMRAVGRHMGNAVNLSRLSRDSALENLGRLAAEFLKLTGGKAGDCQGVCIGVSGLHEPAGKEDAALAEKEFQEKLESAGFGCPVSVVSDSEIMLATETKGGPGVLVTANLDSRSFAIDGEGRAHHCGGYGHLVDGGGGGYAMGISAVKYALMSHDGRIPHTVLEEKVREHFAVNNIEDVVAQIRSGAFGASKISELSLMVKYAAESGDSYAKLIEEMAVKELCLLARALITRCGLDAGTVVLSGPPLLLNDYIRSSFTKLLKKDFPEINIVAMKEKPEMGAAYLAMKDVLREE